MAKNIVFPNIVADGENPRGVVSQTSNGTICDGRGGDGTQERSAKADGGWNSDPVLTTPVFRKRG